MIQPAKIQVRFSDLDVMGHVNNAIYLSYFEYARVHYFGQLLDEKWDWNSNGVLLVRNEIDYLIPVLLNETPVITIKLESIGTKSFTLTYEVKVNEKLVSTGKSIMVTFDSRQKKTIPIPEEMIKALGKLKE